MFRKLALDARHIVGPVDSQMWFVGLNNSDFKTVLQCPQLFQRFGAFQLARRDLCQRAQRVRLIAVEADMTAGRIA